MSGEELIAAASRETHELHVFFEGWLGGTTPKTTLAFERVEQALGAGFSMVAPSGARSGRAAVLSYMWDAYGARGGGDPPFSIWIEDVTPIFVAAEFVAIGYDECQRIDGAPTRRRSTAVFRIDPFGPNGLRWAALHETWVG